MRKFSILFLTSLLFATLSLADGKIRPVSTYSIVAYDRETGQLGVAVQSHWFSVGPIVPWVESGIGAIATQSFVEVSYGPLGLALLKAGKSPEDAIKALVAADKNQIFVQQANIPDHFLSEHHAGAIAPEEQFVFCKLRQGALLMFSKRKGIKAAGVNHVIRILAVKL